jgi:CrcB protein
MRLYILIALGGAIGTVLRYFIGTHVGGAFPWGTLLINVAGSFVIGFVATVAAEGRWIGGTEGRLFFTVGLCGGFTTFSAFSLQTFNLAREGEWIRAGAYVAGSVVLCLVAVGLGHLLANVVNPAR